VLLEGVSHSLKGNIRVNRRCLAALVGLNPAVNFARPRVGNFLTGEVALLQAFLEKIRNISAVFGRQCQRLLDDLIANGHLCLIPDSAASAF
jgi:hypothetical protein